MRSTCVHFDDYLCEVRSHCRLNAMEQARCTCRVDSPASHLDPENPPLEHSAEHPTRFDDHPRSKP